MSLEARLALARSRYRVLALGLTCALTVVACGGKKEEAARPAATTAAPTASASSELAAPVQPEASVADLLAAAKRAENEERLVSPAGDNAIEYYLQVLAKEANNVSATQALVDLFPLAAGNVEREIANRNLDEAERIIALLDRANPGSYTVSTLKSKLNATRIQMQREEERRLAEEEAARQRQLAEAQAAATTSPTPVPTPAPAQPTPAAQAESRPAEPPPKPVITRSEPTPPAQPVAQSREPVLVRQVRPTYPAAAARRKQEGWVEVSFTVGPDGKVNDVKVLRAHPRGVFDREAVRAVSQWQFEPALDNGRPVPRTLTRRIEFTLRAQ